MDIFAKCRRAPTTLLKRQLLAESAYPFFRPMTSSQEPEVWQDGRRMIMLGSNNYLGLTRHPQVIEAAKLGLEQFGSSCTGSRMLNGTIDPHIQLEDRIAAFLGLEAALIFPTGYQANLGVLSSLLSRQDTVVIDALSHASILDGVRLGFGRVLKFRHNDMNHLEEQLASIKTARGCLIVVDGVYSMEGDLCPLPEVVWLAQKHGVRVLVDDAHGLGVFGSGGRGTPAHFGVTESVDLIVGTFSKALASVGGFVAGDAHVIDYVRHNARSGIFSAGLPPASTMAALTALDIMEREPERRARLWENAHYFQSALMGSGFDIGGTESPAIPIVIGEEMTTFRMVKAAHAAGVFVNCVIPPAVPPGRSLVRTSCMATHERHHLDRAVEALDTARAELRDAAPVS